MEFSQLPAREIIVFHTALTKSEALLSPKLDELSKRKEVHEFLQNIKKSMKEDIGEIQ